MLNVTDGDIQALDMTGNFGAHLTSGNSILTGSTTTTGQLSGVDPLICRVAACDQLQWIEDNTDYYAEIGTIFKSSHSYLVFRFFKKEDDSSVLEWQSGPITGRADNSKMSVIHEILGVMMLQKLTSYFYENFEEIV